MSGWAARIRSESAGRRTRKGERWAFMLYEHRSGCLSVGGVAPRTAQAAMRHSKIDLTMNVYTDPRLLDVAGAMDALPDLPIGVDPAKTE